MIHIDWEDGSGRRDYEEDFEHAVAIVKDEHPHCITKQIDNDRIAVYVDDQDPTPVATLREIKPRDNKPTTPINTGPTITRFQARHALEHKPIKEIDRFITDAFGEKDKISIQDLVLYAFDGANSRKRLQDLILKYQTPEKPF